MQPLTAKLNKRRSTRTDGVAKASQWDNDLNGAFAAYLRPTVSVLARARLALTLCRTFNPRARTILDLGCGGGRLALAAQEQGFDRYVGMDISTVAIQVAVQARQASREMYPSSCRFETGHLGSYTPDEVDGGPLPDLIVFSEVLYYLPTPRDAAEEAMRCATWLNHDGAICVSMIDDGKSRAVLRALSQRFTLLDSLLFQEQPSRPRYRIRIDSARPAYLIALLQPSDAHGGLRERSQIAVSATVGTLPSAPDTGAV